MDRYITKDGDTFDLIALYFYYDESLANEIARANPRYVGTIIFDAGIELSIPQIDVKPAEDTPPWMR